MAEDEVSDDSFFDDVDSDFSSDDDPEAVTQGCRASKDPNNKSKTKANRIDLIFDPDKSEKVTKCDKIVHVQFVRITADGVVKKPGDIDNDWKYRDKVVTSDGWWVDHLKNEKTPDYQQGDGGDGKKNGGSGKATMNDTPDIADGGPEGFYNPISNRKGTMQYV